MNCAFRTRTCFHTQWYTFFSQTVFHHIIVSHMLNTRISYCLFIISTLYVQAGTHPYSHFICTLFSNVSVNYISYKNTCSLALYVIHNYVHCIYYIFVYTITTYPLSHSSHSKLHLLTFLSFYVLVKWLQQTNYPVCMCM